jgi:hypothetical protein
MNCAYCGTEYNYPEDFPNRIYAICRLCVAKQEEAEAKTTLGVLNALREAVRALGREIMKTFTVSWDKVNSKKLDNQILDQLYALGYSCEHYSKWYLRIVPIRILNGLRACIVLGFKRRLKIIWR